MFFIDIKNKNSFDGSKFVKFASIQYQRSNSGVDILRILFENISLLEITNLIIQGYAYSEIIKRIATNCNKTIKETRELFSALKDIFKRISEKEIEEFDIWENDELLLSNESSNDQKEQILKQIVDLDDEDS